MQVQVIPCSHQWTGEKDRGFRVYVQANPLATMVYSEGLRFGVQGLRLGFQNLGFIDGFIDRSSANKLFGVRKPEP